MAQKDFTMEEKTVTYKGIHITVQTYEDRRNGKPFSYRAAATCSGRIRSRNRVCPASARTKQGTTHKTAAAARAEVLAAMRKHIDKMIAQDDH